MQFSDEDLKRFIEFMPVGSGQTELHLLRIVNGLKRSHLIDVEAEFNDYGSGTASYVDVFCSKRSGKSTQRKGDTDWIDGIAIYLSRLAPIAIYGPMQRTRNKTGGSFDFLIADVVGTLPPGDWIEEVKEINKKLTTFYGVTLLEKEFLAKKLPFKAKIRTCFKKKGYQIFDAIFYWDD